MLTGSPAQVEWAGRLKALAGAEFDRVAKSFRLVALSQGENKRAETEAILEILKEKRAVVMNQEEAGYFIREWQEIGEQVRKLIGQDFRFQSIQAKRAEHSSTIFVGTKEKVNYMNIRPLYDRLVVKRSDEQERARNGIIIPDSAKEKPQEGTVIAVGNGKRLDGGALVALDVKVGDRILFGKYSGNETKLDGTDYIIIREDEVLGVLSPAAETLKTAATVK